ncbi:hypothetical protein P7K49_029489 [Saguinus oedipus]|uniref:Uncharacterized protein n=1 Tax=Saguinus oedipus TaxID=9490 RepID=A0ABQ9U7B5_SAGOE|nr:hypothetical protein P7K49_029489 [Saguinus oedipus]
MPCPHNPTLDLNEPAGLLMAWTSFMHHHPSKTSKSATVMENITTCTDTRGSTRLGELNQDMPTFAHTGQPLAASPADVFALNISFSLVISPAQRLCSIPMISSTHLGSR